MMRLLFGFTLLAAYMGSFHALAQPVDISQDQTKPASKSSDRNAKKSRADKSSTQAQKEPLPCPRAAYKDDPVCFGEDDSDKLPLPSSGRQTTGYEMSKKSGKEITVEPIGSLNNPTQHSVHLNLPNPNPLGTQFGGGAKVNVPFEWK